MYERNAIVLERYFNKLFKFNEECNLRENYYNYRKLFECYGVLCEAKESEEVSKKEFDEAEKEIVKLQKSQERLYNKGAKFEYSRYIIFNNTEENIGKIEKNLSKVSDDVQKNCDELKELGDMFIQAISNYSEKSKNLKEAVEKRENAQSDYDEIYKISKACFKGLSDENIVNIKEFINSENRDVRKELQETFEENGKKEKNPFDPDVISNTINRSIDIYKIEMDIYLNGYDRISKLFEEIDADFVKNEKHKKFYKDSEAKVDFLNSEKDYIVQFLDNERIGAIYDKKVHRKLMLEACKKFALDFEQIDKLYDIITKEISGRVTKKLYKENYNKEYLVELENSSVEPSLDTGKMRQEAIAFMNLNYWRVEGIRNIYDVFEKIVTTIYERDLTEFLPEEVVAPEEPVEVVEEKVVENIEENQEEIVEEAETEEVEETENDVEELDIIEETPEEKQEIKKVYYSTKKQLARAIYYSLQNIEFAKDRQNIIEELPTEEEEKEDDYSIPENVEQILRNVEREEKAKEEEIKELEVKEVAKENLVEETENFDLSKLDDIEYEEDDISTEEVEKTEEFSDDEYEEESILNVYFKDDEEKNDAGKVDNKNNGIEKKTSFFKKLAGLNSKKKSEA